MIRSEILKKQLAEYERKATALEGVVLNDLKHLEKRKNARDIVIIEGKIQSRLRRLDSYQEEIDSITAELKEAGEFEYPDYSGNVYVYKIQKQPKQKPLKIQVSEARAKQREETAKHKVYSPETTDQRKRREAKEAAAERRLEAAALKALQKPQKGAERKPRAKAESKPRESRELQLQKKRKDSLERRIRNSHETFRKERAALEVRLEERKAKVLEVADIPGSQGGNQKRQTARQGLELVEQRIREHPQRRVDRLRSLLAQLEDSKQQIEFLSKV